VVLASCLALELLNIAPLLLELSVLSIDLSLLVVCSVFETLELISDQTATQSTHSSTDRGARARCAYCRTDNRTARRPQAASYKGASFSSVQRLRTGTQYRYQSQRANTVLDSLLYAHKGCASFVALRKKVSLSKGTRAESACVE